MMQYAEIGDDVYFWFAANTTAGAAGDGATPLFDVRLAGAAANAAPTASGTPTLLTHADYPDGIHEIKVDTDAFAAGEYAVFCSLTISSVNPAGFCGAFKLRTAGTAALNVNTTHVGGTLQTGRDIGASVLLSSGTGAGQLDFTSGVVKSNLVQILASALSGTAAQIAAAFVKLFDVATPSLTAASKDQTGDAYAQIGTAGAGLTAIPWNASWDAEVQSECTDALNAYDPPTKAEVDTACGAVTLKNGAHGGAAATVTLKSVVVDNSEGDAVNFKSTAANKMALKLEGAGTGNSHALYLNSTNGSAIAGASGSHGVSITSSAGHGMVIAGATGDIVADITGDLSGAVGSITTAVDINSNADITAILQDTGTTLDGKINTLDTVVDLIEDIVRNKMEVVEATGAATLYADDSTTPLLTNTVTSAGGTTTRTRLA